jgi:hypothetical protein
MAAPTGTAGAAPRPAAFGKRGLRSPGTWTRFGFHSPFWFIVIIRRIILDPALAKNPRVVLRFLQGRFKLTYQP